MDAGIDTPPFVFSSGGINSSAGELPFYEEAQWQDQLKTQMTISCLQCDWSVETVNTPGRCHLRSLKLRMPTRMDMGSTPSRSFNV